MLNVGLKPVFKYIAINQLCTPQDIINGIRFLIDPPSSYLTETNINIDEGYMPYNILSCRLFESHLSDD